MEKKKQITAIMNSEMENLLKYTNQYEQLVKGELKCKCCGKKITLDNIGIVIPCKIDEHIVLSFVCNDIRCNLKQ